MKLIPPKVLSTAALVGLLLVPSSLLAASGEVFVTGSTWTGRVDGTTRYTGSSMAAAINACVNNMSSGTITIKNSGNMNGQANIKSNITIDGTGRTLNSTGSVAMIYAQNSSSVGARNINMSSNSWYGIQFRTCNGMTISSVSGSANMGYRIDNCKGGPGYNLSAGSPTLNNGGAHAFETYGIQGVSFGTVSASDRTTGCGLILNYSTNATGTTVNGTRCDWNGGGYAGFRVANDNGKTTLGTVNSTSCGRGFFSVSGSRDATITTVNSTVSKSHGVWLQTTYNSRVNGGTVRSGNPCSAISGGSGNHVSVSCQ
jgi:hypothetical protein